MDLRDLFSKNSLITKTTINGLSDLKSLVSNLKFEKPSKPADDKTDKEKKKAFAEQLRKTQALTTKKLRQALLLITISKYQELKFKECFVSNETLSEELLEFGLEASVTTIKADLAEIEAQGLIKREFQKLSFENTLRTIKTFLNPILERLINSFKKIFLSNRNKCIAIPQSIHEVVQFFVEDLRKPASEAMRFFHYFSQNGWKIGSDSVISWQGMASCWQSFK